MSQKKRNSILLLVVVTFCTAAVSFQFYCQKLQHERLLSKGIRTATVSTASFRYGVESIDYYFLDQTGDTIKGSQKTGDERSKFWNATVIYDPQNPHDYEFTSDFDSYNTRSRVIFFYCFYLPIMTGVVYGFTNGALGLFQKLRSDKNKA